LPHFLQAQGLTPALVSSIAVARTREALYNSWDKNDPLGCSSHSALAQHRSHPGLSWSPDARAS
jgi:hypothetical protein